MLETASGAATSPWRPFALAFLSVGVELPEGDQLIPVFPALIFRYFSPAPVVFLQLSLEPELLEGQLGWFLLLCLVLSLV